MLSWLPYISAIVSAIIQIIKLLKDLTEKQKADKIKECSVAIEEARKSGNFAKLEQILASVKKGGSCK